MVANMLDGSLEDVLERALDGVESDTYLLNPGPRTIEALASVGDRIDPPTIHLVADERTFRDAMDDFIVASSTADLVAEGYLDVRTVEDYDANEIVVTGDRLIALVDAGGHAAGLVAADPSFVDRTRDACGATWETADDYTLRTPPISRVRETLTADLGEDAEADFSRALETMGTARGNGDGLDEVTVSLLVAAKNEELFYDISRWGEDVGVASKATFSRVKSELEESGLIGTEKVPVEVGRPRQRLTIEDERLEGADTAQLTSVAETVLN